MDCPFCQKELKKIPQYQMKCPACKKMIYVKQDPESGVRIYVDGEKAKMIDKYWDERRGMDKELQELGYFGITEEYFSNKKKSFKQDYGFLTIDKNLTWEILNELKDTITYLQLLRRVYFNMALMSYQSEKEFFQYLYESKKCDLLQIQQTIYKYGVTQVQINATNGCSSCKKLHGKKIDLLEAIEKMPIPNPKCTHKIYDLKKGWCRCIYTAIIDVD